MKSLIKNIIKKIPLINTAARMARDKAVYFFGKRKLVRALNNKPLRIVIGASGIAPPGWIKTDIQYLNLLNVNDWEFFFFDNQIDAILSEHVWEHLSELEGLTAAKNCFRFLKQGGYLRVAVPDGFHPNPNYINSVRVGGTGPAAFEHKVLYNYKSFARLFEQSGFNVVLLEYFDESGEFHYKNWSPEDGMIHRSKRFDKRNGDGNLNYTSIILDAVKPV